MKKKMMKALKDLNAYIDNDHEKLCDRIHDLELSHKRMERLLRRSLRYIESISFIESDNGDYNSLCDALVRELSYPYYRVQYRMKGGKDA